MDVSVIIVNYNTLALTQQCLDSVFEKTKDISFEVILVDNGSTDGSQEVFSKDDRITYIYSEENLGFGKANNLGYEHATGKYLFLLNSDTYLVNNAIRLLWEKMESLYEDKQGKVACLGCMLRDEKGEMIHSYAKFPTMCHTFLEATLYPVLWKLHLIPQMPTTSNDGFEKANDSSFDVDYITGADLMIRKEVADQLGMFDPDFFMYSEETELQYRYMKKGYRRMICQDPHIVHLEGRSNKEMSPYRTTIVLKSKLLYIKKTSAFIPYVVFSFLTKMCHFLTYLLTFPFLSGDAKGKVTHLWATIKM